MDPNARNAQRLREQSRNLVFADVILRPSSGKSVLKEAGKISPENVRSLLPDPKAVERAQSIFAELGFRISFAGPTHITISGPKETFEEVFRISFRIESAQRTTIETAPQQNFVVPTGPVAIPTVLEALVEGIQFPRPITYFAASPPPLAYDHMLVPQDVARGMDALKAHQVGITGAGIRLAIVDSGFTMPHHAYYVSQGYTIQATVSDPADPDPGVDPDGHGTGISACALAVAPGCTLLPFKIFGGFISPGSAAAAFGRAVSAGPHIIMCSWGIPVDPVLQMAINAAIANGIVICVAVGNGGTVGWPSTEPAVIAVGGAFLANDDTTTASSVASSGTNAANPGRQVPDVCGICGNAPRGILITMPSGAGSLFDSGLAGAAYPMQDTTTATDGWFVSSGTSGANAMVAGVAALVLEANPGFTPAQVKTRLMDSCIDVTGGTNASRETAGMGLDNATGRGLVQAYCAVRDTDIWLRDNETSDIGLVPTHSRRPAYPPHAHWTSPDIRVFENLLANPGIDFDTTPTTNPVYNQDNFVYVRVRNRGRQAATTVTVELYYADPSTSLAFPADWNDGQSGVFGQGSIEVATIATNQQNGVYIPANGSFVIPEPYVFRPPDPSNATQQQTLPDGRIAGHFCLLVRMFSANDAILASGGGETSIVEDNNLGMKNVHVFSAPPGHFLRFTFSMRAPRQKIEGLHALDFALQSLPKGAKVRISPKEGKLTGKWIGAYERNGYIEVQPGEQRPRLVGIEFAAYERVILEMSCELPDATPKGDYPIDVVQLAGGQVVGGVRLVARSTDPKKGSYAD